MNAQYFKIDRHDKVAHVSINRPEKMNALHAPAWEEMKAIFDELSHDKEVRCVILSGEGKLFCAGIDLELLMSVRKLESVAEAQRVEMLHEMILDLQAPINAIEQCQKPVLAAVHNGCIGAGVDIIAACDLRYCTADAYFTIKEIDMGMVADLGTLQRLPKFAKPAVVAEMGYTGRPVGAEEALEIGLVNGRYDTKEDLINGAMNTARLIASKSPVAIRGTKVVLRHARDHHTADGLAFIADWNARRLLSDDLTESFLAAMEKRKPVYKD